jgi:hypothetical protein
LISKISQFTHFFRKSFEAFNKNSVVLKFGLVVLLVVARLSVSEEQNPKKKKKAPQTRYEIGQVFNLVRPVPTQFTSLKNYELAIRELNFKMFFEKTMDDSAPMPSNRPYYKSEEQLAGLWNMLFTGNPHIIGAAEIQNARALDLLENRDQLDDYDELVIEGNDQSGINVGYFVRKDFPFHMELRSHKNLVDNQFSSSPLFRRDAATLILRVKEGASPFLILMMAHLKSQMPIPKGDQSKVRGAEAEAFVWLESQLRKEFGEVPVLILGDINNDHKTAPELQVFGQNKFVDLLDLVGFVGPRHTHFYFNRSGRASFSQLDAVLFNEFAQKTLVAKSGAVVDQLDEKGQTIPDPKSYKEKEGRPSDHKATDVVLDLSKILP